MEIRLPQAEEEEYYYDEDEEGEEEDGDFEDQIGYHQLLATVQSLCFENDQAKKGNG